LNGSSHGKVKTIILNGEVPVKKTYDRLIMLSFGVALLILVFIGGMSYLTTNSLIETNAKALDTSRVIEKLNILLAKIYRGESSARGYILSEASEDYDSFQSAITDVREDLKALEPIFAGNPEQKARLDALKSAVVQKINFSTQKIELRRSQGFNAAQKFFLTGRDETFGRAPGAGGMEREMVACKPHFWIRHQFLHAFSRLLLSAPRNIAAQGG
jgi:CHASE3 domain sensor protein